jgi:opacity protein-like surface antigen
MNVETRITDTMKGEIEYYYLQYAEEDLNSSGGILCHKLHRRE